MASTGERASKHVHGHQKHLVAKAKPVLVQCTQLHVARGAGLPGKRADVILKRLQLITKLPDDAPGLGGIALVRDRLAFALRQTLAHPPSLAEMNSMLRNSPEDMTSHSVAGAAAGDVCGCAVRFC